MAPTSVVIAPGIYAIAITDRRHFIHSATNPSPTSCIPTCNPHNANLWLCSSGSALFGSGFVLETPQSSRKKGGTEEPAVADASCSLSGRAGEGEASTSGYTEKPWAGIRNLSNRRTHPSQNAWGVRAERDPSSSGENGEDVSVQVTVEENKRLLALQKELLEQVTERKKLLNSLTQDFGTSKGHPGSSEVEKLEKDGSPIGLQEPSPPKRAPGIGAWPPQGTRPALKLQTPSGSPESNSSSPVTFSSGMPTVSPDVQRRPRPPDLGPKTTEFQQTSEPLPNAETKNVEKKVLEKPPPLAGPNVMNVVVVAAECAPWSKTGGLGDVVGALPKALARRGHRVMAVSPRYSNYAEAWETGVRRIYNVAGQDMEVGYFHAYIDGVDFVFIDSPIFHAWAHDIYGGSREDVLTRMILFCKAAVEVPWHVSCGGACYGDGNLVFIANDWHTALLPVYLQAFYRDNQLMQYTRSVLVIHNIAHQGRGPLDDFRKLGLPDHYRDKFALYDPIGGEHMNIFMAGLITSHRVIAVSHGYAWECQTQEGGWGLDWIIRDHSWKLRGVVNGIDDKEWNPELDPCLRTDGYTNYNIDTLERGKAVCKAALQKELGLPVRPDVPLLGFIGRLDYQKGVDIIAEAMPWMMSQDLQLVMLGSGRADLEEMLRSFESNHRDKARGWVGFSVVTAHRITAGVDILLMPSRFEPCGLNQLYAMRYGTVPVVHAVGGLRDTVKAFDPFSEQGLGWTFDRAEAAGLIHAIGNALWTYRDFKGSWRGIQRRGMSQDLSWDNAAQQYEEVLVAAKYQW